MKIYKILLSLISASLFNCNPKQKNNADEYINALNQKEEKHLDKIYENTDELIAEINFELSATDEQKAEWPEGIIPWISIEHPQTEINQLINADEIVIREKKVSLIIDYPLNNPANIELTSNIGFSRKDLILAISSNYHKIYDDEEASAKTKTIPYEKRTGLINRNQTDGKYGIWGHDIADLDLSTIEVYSSKDGKIVLILVVES